MLLCVTVEIGNSSNTTYFRKRLRDASIYT